MCDFFREMAEQARIQEQQQRELQQERERQRLRERIEELKREDQRLEAEKQELLRQQNAMRDDNRRYGPYCQGGNWWILISKFVEMRLIEIIEIYHTDWNISYRVYQ